jgi:hypothetical protein
VETPGSLAYSVINNHTSLVNVLVNAGNGLDISFMPNAHGSAAVTIQAKDPAGATGTAVLNVIVNSVEDIPSAFNLLTPANGSIVANPNEIEFSWEASVDGDDDVLTYLVTIRGPQLDTTMTLVDATSVMFNGSSLFAANATYQWFVSVSDGDDAASSQTFTFKVLSTAVHDPYTLINYVEAYPNPVVSYATINYALKTEAIVTVKVYSFLGQEIATLSSGKQLKGEYAVRWDANDAAAGVYFYELMMETEDGMEGSFVGKMIKQ